MGMRESICNLSNNVKCQKHTLPFLPSPLAGSTRGVSHTRRLCGGRCSSVPPDGRPQHSRHKFISTEPRPTPVRTPHTHPLQNHHRTALGSHLIYKGWEDTGTSGSRHNPFSYPHTPSFLFPLFSTFSVLSIISVSPIPATGLLSSSEGSAAPPAVGSAGFACIGCLDCTELPCSCNRQQVCPHSESNPLYTATRKLRTPSSRYQS